MDIEKVFYNPGDLVKVRHDIENVPTMYVVRKVSTQIRDGETNKISSTFAGIMCRWFDKNQVMHESMFSTKDLMHV